MKSEMNGEPTIQDVLDALNVFSTHVDSEFRYMHDEFGRIHQEFGKVYKEFGKVYKEFDHVYEELGLIRGDFGNVARKGNTKLTVLIDSLISEKSLDPNVAKRILALEPFAQA